MGNLTEDKIKVIAENSRASQDKEELEALLLCLNDVEIKRVLEIGTWRGYSAEVWVKAFRPELLISIDIGEEQDLWDGLENPGKTDVVYGYGVDSHDPKSFLYIVKILQKNLIDFLFIDGDHSYEGVKKDFDMYSPLVRKGGLIAFHDVAVKDNDSVEVYKFWEELKTRYPYRLIHIRGTGVGVIHI